MSEEEVVTVASLRRAQAKRDTQDIQADVSTLLGIGTRGPWLVYAVFAVANLAFVVATLDAVKSWIPSVIALVIVNAAAYLLLRPAPDPLPIEYAIAVWVAVVLSAALVSWQVIGDVGRESWFMLANTWLVFFVVLRGRVGWAWASFLSMIIVHAWWAFDTERSVVSVLLGYQTHAGVLFTASLLGLGLKRTSRRINALRLRSLELSSSTAAAEAERQVREDKLNELSQVAAPLLARVASGPDMTREDRIECLLAEATLRDSVRAGVLHDTAIAQSATRARRRGVEVTLLDDRGTPLASEHAMRLLFTRVIEILETIEHGRVSVRLAPPGRRIAASIVVDQEGRVRRTDLDESGEPLDAAAMSAATSGGSTGRALD